jgi:hypothetical protein
VSFQENISVNSVWGVISPDEEILLGSEELVGSSQILLIVIIVIEFVG